MMAGLFLLMALVILLVFFKIRNVAIAILLLTILLAWLMLWHHATDTLQINW